MRYNPPKILISRFQFQIEIWSDNIFLQPKLIKSLIKTKNLNLDYISYKINNKNAVLTHWGLFGEYVTLKALEKNKIFKFSEERFRTSS